jgi:hypothetical protein
MIGSIIHELGNPFLNNQFFFGWQMFFSWKQLVVVPKNHQQSKATGELLVHVSSILFQFEIRDNFKCI